VVVVGAGFGGLGTARALRERGIDDVVVLERAASVGGVWRDNTYPGAACDVPSPLYSWSWAVNPGWSHRYAGQGEILDYLRHAAEREGLLGLVRTGVEVVACTYRDAPEPGERRWRVEAVDAHGDRTTYDADVVVSAVGQLSEPVVPGVAGAESFAGPVFHSARWRHDVDLAGQRVAVVGTGASAVQLVPGIVDEVGSLSVFQRSAAYVVPRPDTEFSARRRRLFARVPATLRLERRVVLVATELLNRALTGQARWGPAALRLVRLVWRAHLRRQVRDRVTRRALVPDYPIGCKRILFSDTWYPALDRDHVELVTGPGGAVDRIEPEGVRTADGRLHPADVLVWGTGFAATDLLASMRVTGEGGADLHEAWADGARAHLGLAVPGFPSFFCVYGPNTNLGGSSIIGMLEAQAEHIAEVAARMADDGARVVGVRRDAAVAFDEATQERLEHTVWATCDSWYRDGGRITTNWPGTVGEYQDRTARVDWSAYDVS